MLFVLTAQSLMAQAYKPMSQFGTDTLNYLKYNFETRKSQYIGYSLEKVINDYELAMEDVKYSCPFFSNVNKDCLTGISISHFTEHEFWRKWNNKSPMVMFDVDFEPPYADYWVTTRTTLPFPARDRALYIKDKIVKDIRVYIFDRNAPKPPPTEPFPYTFIDVDLSSQKFTVTININGNGAATGAGEYNIGSNVTIKATALSGYTFTGWQGDITSTVNPFTITNISKNMSITAKFTANPPTDPGGGGKKPKEIVPIIQP